MARELERQANLLQRGQVAGQRGVAPGTAIETFTVDGRRLVRIQSYTDVLNSGGAWWTNTALVARLGLTDDQKARIERAFEAHRQNIVSGTAALEKEETQLARLLEAEPLVRGAVLAQSDRVIQARSDLERTNAAMTVEMREHLTRAQWMQLQSESIGLTLRYVRQQDGLTVAPAPGTPGTRGATPGQIPGARGGGARQ
jgi:Spy/CpxP family protein refolding chaperone